MMRPAILLLFFLLPGAVLAQNTASHVLQVVADDAFVRAAPDLDSPLAASVYANDNLIAIGRNIDGTWLEVRRPGRETSLGWIARDLVLLSFEIGQLPLTDSTSGLTGPEAVVDTGFAVLTIDEVSLFAAPDRGAAVLAQIPVYLTLPVIERTPNLQWLKVNFRGTTGWIQQFLTSTRADLQAVPVSLAYSGDARYAAFATISLEQQLAQIDRLLSFIAPKRQTAADVTFYWRLISEGETRECRPPAGNYAYFSVTPQDVIELPELRKQIRLLTEAVDDINAAVATMQPCGVYLSSQIRGAYANALNARNIFDQVTRRMETLRTRILDDPNRVETPAGGS